MTKPWELMRDMNRMNFKIMLAGHSQKPAGWRNGPYAHRFHSLWLMSKGKATFVLNGTAYAAEPGKLFALAPGMVVERINEGEGPIEFFFIRFAYAVSAFEEDGSWTFADDGELPFPLSGSYSMQNIPPLLNAFEQVLELTKHRGQIVQMRQRILFLDILTLIVSDLRSQIVTGHTNAMIETTIDYMVGHYAENMTVEELAKMAGMSSSHYSRLFKKYASASPIHYLTQLRMDRAKELLILSDYKLKAVAQSIGYEDELYFSRLFKKFTGQSPSQYAKTHKAAPNG
ncbi:AraC family transcriptional regulator [Paenibacillus sp. LHD-117]|uniref:AraC family transcriptional regulator n=1 Tax=Paenibacillus sp. LHD-117 TaxID=3071412 RepID=UPI0027DEFB01|nr:AraC family transcriptional regulator [Paenibacillus sp. LHD-117]MDQ6419532.1 AraC family transcriptional regulator [Paenibacillus sp. LHD-117]